GHRRAMDLHVEVPGDELGPVASNEMWGEIYDRVAELVRAHRTTLIFVSTRRMSERVAFNLTSRLGEGLVMPHHGSLSREKRFEAENRLKNGELKAVVATASLELGIDIGTVDLVVQLGSPRSIAVALQRIGRSGHWIGAKPEGKLFPTTRDELLETAALVRAIRTGKMDALTIPRAPLDILAQQLVALCSADEEWAVDDLFDAVRTAYPYRDLAREDFDQVVTMLAEGVATSRGRSGAYLFHDRVNGRLRARRGARLAAITSGGAIPETANYNVVAEPDGHVVGTVDEDFAVESMAGDIFLLGTTSWQIRRVEPGVVRVQDAHGAPPSIPFWNGEGRGRTIELSHEVAALRTAIDERDDATAVDWLIAECALDRAGAEQAVAYVRAGKTILGVVPTTETLVAERFFDEAGGMQLILHTPFGARINRAWGLALRKKFCRSFNLELQAAATDNGVLLSLTDQHAFPLEIVWEYVKSASVEETLKQALLTAPMFGARWRWNATRALAILRMRGGKKVPPPIQRMRADDLLASCFPDAAACAENLTGPIRIPDHILVRETIDNCLREAMDVDGLIDVLRAIEARQIRTVAVDTPEPSPFCHEILNANPFAYLDDAPLEERRARAVTLRRTLRSDGDGTGILDPAVFAEVTEEVWPVVRDADELHDALASLVVLPPVETWRAWYDELVAQRRATTLTIGTMRFWTCAERLDLALIAYPGAAMEPAIASVPPSQPLPERQEDAFAEILRGWLESSGPLTVAEMAERFAADPSAIEIALIRLETEGQVLRGRFRGGEAEEWCNRRVLARIHRLTLGVLRREIEPVSTAEYVRFLYRWQHVAPGARLHGIDGTLQIVKQLEGCEIPAAAWEASVLPARVAGYKREYLDHLCYSGEIMWGRLSPHPALTPNEDEERQRRIRPTKLAPIALLRREDAEALIVARDGEENAALSHAAREVLDEIKRRGAPFFGEIVRGTKRLPSEVEEALWQLVAAGLVTADGFDALRSLIDAKRRLGEKGLRARPRSSSGRWTLLRSETERIDADVFARRLLERWGVVFRDVVVRESLAPPWRELLGALRRMEARGEIRGGRFVHGYVGEQFALPEAVEALRAARRNANDADIIDVSDYDPLRIANALLPTPAPKQLQTAAVSEQLRQNSWRIEVPLFCAYTVVAMAIRCYHCLYGVVEEITEESARAGSSGHTVVERSLARQRRAVLFVFQRVCGRSCANRHPPPRPILQCRRYRCGYSGHRRGWIPVCVHNRAGGHDRFDQR
ncbi:MAG: hypothetical protein JO164_00385, partial [Candidatus Eremiobacteraeota bacterium]|nr:hypothetical protein [Candidatus Eremiobacteraeota bacterium]